MARRRVSTRAAALAVAAVLAGAAAWRWQAAPAPIGIVLITVDTLRADRLGAYGATTVRTPALDRLAAEGVRFDAAYATAPLTLPSHVSMLSGLLPVEHTVRTNDGYRVPDGVPLAAEALRAAGLRTAAIVGSVVLRGATGLARGFERYDDTFDGPERPACDVTARAAEWLFDVGDAPFFLWLHLYDPHLPYEPPPPFASEYAGRPYDGEVAYVDSCLGALRDRMEQAGLLSRSAIVAVADHGEGLGEHGERSHGTLLYDSTVRVPLIVRPPGGAAPAVATEPVSVAQVAPTVLALAGLPRPGVLPGLLDADRALEPVSIESLYLAQQLGWSPLYAGRSGAIKVIDAPSPELYDLRRDPGETEDLAAVEDEALARLRGALRRELAAAAGRAAPPAAAATDPDRARQLAALGYVSGGRPIAGVPAVEGIDPKGRQDVWRFVEEGLERAQTGQPGEAAAAFERVLALDPGNVLALKYLGAAALAGGDLPRAIALNERVAASGLHEADARANLALAYLRAGRVGDAVTAGRMAVGADGTHRAARANLALALQALGASRARAGDAAGAVETFQEAADLVPGDLDAGERLAAALHRAGRREEARARFEAVARADPGRPAPQLSLAILDLEAGRPREAAARLQRIGRGWPGAYQAQYYLGEAFRALGDAAGARSAYAASVNAAPAGDPLAAAARRALESVQ